MSVFDDPVWRWEPWPTDVVVALGMARVSDGEEDPKFKRRPVGFTADLQPSKGKPRKRKPRGGKS